MSDKGNIEWMARLLCKTENPSVDPDGSPAPGSGPFTVPLDFLGDAMMARPRNWHTRATQAMQILQAIRHRVSGRLSDTETK